MALVGWNQKPVFPAHYMSPIRKSKAILPPLTRSKAIESYGSSSDPSKFMHSV